MEQSDGALLQVRGVTKRFPGVLALNEVSMDVRRGEVHGLVGKNGAGKSTLMNIVTGLLAPDSGEITFNGQHLVDITPAKARDMGIAMVPQEMRLVGPLSVGENIFGGHFPTERGGFIAWNQVYRQAAEMLGRLGQTQIDPRARVENLSVVERQIVSIAKSLFAGAQLIILDEPTAALSHVEVQTLFSLVRGLKEQGVTFVFISHYLGEVFEICDRVTILRNGAMVDTRPTASLTEADLAYLMVGRGVELAKRSTVAIGEPILTVKGLTKAGRFYDVSFELHRGEILGLAGLATSGKTELALCLFGLDRPDSGDIYMDGRRLDIHSPFVAFNEGIAYLPEDRRKHGLIPGQSLKHNISLPILRQLLDRFGFLVQRQEDAVAQRVVEQLAIITPSLSQIVDYLSGGNQQKVVVGKLLATTPKVLLLGDPTRGIDVEAKTEVYRIVDSLSAQGLGLILISDEIVELLNICDRILVMFQGRIVQEFLRGQAGAHDILMATEGVKING
jgi:ABC-type sugar transport system ATPase subunit